MKRDTMIHRKKYSKANPSIAKTYSFILSINKAPLELLIKVYH